MSYDVIVRSSITRELSMLPYHMSLIPRERVRERACVYVRAEANWRSVYKKIKLILRQTLAVLYLQNIWVKSERDVWRFIKIPFNATRRFESSQRHSRQKWRTGRSDDSKFARPTSGLARTRDEPSTHDVSIAAAVVVAWTTVNFSADI